MAVHGFGVSGRDRLRRRFEIDGRGSPWVEIGWRRLFILPTPSGWVLILTSLLLLVGAMNFDSALGFILGFLVAGVLLASLYLANRNLLGLQLQAQGADPVHAGQPLEFGFMLHNPSRIERHEIRLSLAGAVSDGTDLAPGAQGRQVLQVPTGRRGRLDDYRIGVESRYPAALFRAFAHVRVHHPIRVWPRMERGEGPLRYRPAVEDAAQGPAAAAGSADEDFQGLRDFARGDSPRHIAWRRFARDAALVVKTFSGETPEVVWLDWEDFAIEDTETRLAHLCGAAVELERRGVGFGVRIPGHSIAPDSGHSHLLRVLNQLADHADARAVLG